MSSPSKPPSRLSLAYRKADTNNHASAANITPDKLKFSTSKDKNPDCTKLPTPEQNGDTSKMESPELKVCGLKNLGNTCYLNSVLQVLRFTPTFVSQLKHLKHQICAAEKHKKQNLPVLDKEKSDDKSVKDSCSELEVVKSLSNLYERMKKSELKSSHDQVIERPGVLIYLIRQLNPMFDGYLQQDAQELLRCLLCYVQDAESKLTSMKSKGDYSGSGLNGVCKDVGSSMGKKAGTLFQYFNKSDSSLESKSSGNLIDGNLFPESGDFKNEEGNKSGADDKTDLDNRSVDASDSSSYSSCLDIKDNVRLLDGDGIEATNGSDRAVSTKNCGVSCSKRIEETMRKFMTVNCLKGSGSGSELIVKRGNLRRASSVGSLIVDCDGDSEVVDSKVGQKKRLSLTELDIQENSMDGFESRDRGLTNKRNSKKRNGGDNVKNAAKKRKVSKNNDSSDAENTSPSKTETGVKICKNSDKIARVTDNKKTNVIQKSLSDIFSKRIVKRLGVNGPAINCKLIKFSKLDDSRIRVDGVNIKPVLSLTTTDMAVNRDVNCKTMCENSRHGSLVNNRYMKLTEEVTCSSLITETVSSSGSSTSTPCKTESESKNMKTDMRTSSEKKVTFYSPTKRRDGSLIKVEVQTPDLVERLFAGTMMLCTRCCECETTSSRKEPFHDVSVPLNTHTDQHKHTDKSEESNKSCDNDDYDSGEDEDPNDGLSHLMSAFSDPEQLRDDNKYFCSQCLTYTEAERSIKYDTLPRIVTLHLKRFSTSMTGHEMSKINDHISTCLTLPCLRSACQEPCIRQDHRFTLYAVISHCGVSITSGHYTSYVRVHNSSHINAITSHYHSRSVPLGAKSSEHEHQVFYKDRLFSDINDTMKSESKVINESETESRTDAVVIHESESNIETFPNGFNTKRNEKVTSSQNKNIKLHPQKLDFGSKCAYNTTGDWSKFVYKATDDWLKCDDEKVTLLSAEDFQTLLSDKSSTQCSPYVLFYVSNADL